MQVHCSNCNTAHNFSHEELKMLNEPVIHCSGCDKKIKMQFCPGCGAFYSVTFSNIQPGRYGYKCRKCGMDFHITIPARYPGTKTENSPAPAGTQTWVSHPAPPGSEYTGTIMEPEVNALQGSLQPDSAITFMQNSINTFSVSELFSIAGTAFSIKKLLPAAIAALIMLLSLRVTALLQSMYQPAGPRSAGAAYLLLDLFPAALMLSFYMMAAAIAAKVTLERIFRSNEPGWNAIAAFALKKCPSIFVCNIALLLMAALALALFGRIPLLGPLLFSIAFLPVYLFSLLIAVLLLAGIWFYSPVTAHLDGGIFANFRNLLLFIKKHNLVLLYMIPVALMLALVTFAIVFIIHTFALTLTIAISKTVLSGEASAIFSAIPAWSVKISEAAVSGVNASIFREMSSDITIVHSIAGMVLGASITLITVLLISLFFSITATISTHIYIMMERGLTVDDRRKALTMFILFLFLAALVMLKRMM